jgi:catechol 2,3-dioxygenase-like lactoylglutathione lyase family enzyme
VDWKLEVIVVPVADQDVAKEFYMEKVGFGLDVDHRAGESFRVVQLTPPGSACSITLMRMPEQAGSLSALQIVVPDIDAARAQLVERGAGPSDLFHFVDGEQRPGPDPERRDYGSFFSFRDPDGNMWLVQEVPSRAG